ncbi:DUF6702 family protein [Chitinophaga sp. sic0106]|uniref:DUF6702 family protein n=1 Tax=Chitinophaga sp. sic0106 TaxID=2854785 RepID=UPI001C43F1BC|nr:hypothetical protein [Chitinophaga sp. sic0106]
MGLLLCKWWVGIVLAMHPFYASVTEITHNAAHQELEVSTRIFTDDLEKTLKKQFKTSFDIIKPANRKQVEGFIAAYLQQHLSVKVDGKPVALKFIGYKIEEDAVWSFLEVGHVAAPKKVEVRNDVLYEQHATQTNMVHVIVGGKRQSYKLDNPQATAVFGF